MKKSEIYSEVMDKVCDICEISRKSIINGLRFESVVDARVLAIQAMRRVGLTNEDIALYIHREKQGDNLAMLSRTDLKSKARGIQKSYVAMNAIASDHRDSIRSFLPEQDFLRLSYKMAVDKLTDADRRQYIRAYYNV